MAFTSAMLFVQQTIMYNEVVINDKRLHIVDRAGDRAAAILDMPEPQEAFRSLTVDPVLAQGFKKMREGTYGYYLIRQAGSHREVLTRPVRGLLLVGHRWQARVVGPQHLVQPGGLRQMDAPPVPQPRRAHAHRLPARRPEYLRHAPREPHLPTGKSQRFRSPPPPFAFSDPTPRSALQANQVSSAVAWGMGYSIPFAMLARWSGRRALSLPMNGLQRLLLGAWMYVELPTIFRELWYLQQIREKASAARVMVKLFGSFDEEFEEMGIDYGATPDAS